MPSPTTASALRTALLLAIVIVVGVIAGIVGMPLPAVVIFTSGAGAAFVVRHMADARQLGAAAAAPDAIERYPVRFPADRFAYGPVMQLKFLPPARRVYSPGLFCARADEVAFVPSKPKRASRAWSGAVDELDVVSVKINPNACVVRVRAAGDAGRAQFVVYATPADVRAALTRFVSVTAPAS